MNHLAEEQLVDGYYGALHPEARRHLDQCEECRLQLGRMKETLDAVRDCPAPERGDDYGREVWGRLLPQLPVRKPRRVSFGLRWWTVSPAVVALIVIAFVAGIWTEQRRQLGFTAAARERVLLIALSDHLERSQILLTELVNAAPADADLVSERDRARDLIEKNRLLRQTALRAGDAGYAALLDDLERVLLDVANSPANLSAQDLETLQHRIESEGLLFKVRITSTDAREKEQKL